MKIFKYLLYTLGLLVALFLLFVIFSTLTDYRPDEQELIFASEESADIQDSVFDAVIWNIGYAGLDASMDFFYDGGQQVRPSKSNVEKNLKGILSTLDSYHDFDFILLQEVDKGSKRSYYHNIYEHISNLFEPFNSAYGSNYDVYFVPLPVKAPMGRVQSGLQTISSELPSEVRRFSFPGNYSWPMGVFMLDRCFLESRYKLSGGKELVLINTHNSAYDDGSLRSQQMDFMKEILLREYGNGNYVIVGGDWNQTPFGFKPGFEKDVFDTEDLTYVEADYPGRDWTWAYDSTEPTNRRVKTPYVQGETATTVIDYFLLSPNVELINVKGIRLDFTYSDHQPVSIQFKLK